MHRCPMFSTLLASPPRAPSVSSRSWPTNRQDHPGRPGPGRAVRSQVTTPAEAPSLQSRTWIEQQWDVARR